MNRYERESTEFQPITITVDGAPATDGVTFAITPSGQRPVTYAAPVTIDGKAGVMVQGLEPGAYNVWARVDCTPESVVINCGSILIT